MECKPNDSALIAERRALQAKLHRLQEEEQRLDEEMYSVLAQIEELISAQCDNRC